MSNFQIAILTVALLLVPLSLFGLVLIYLIFERVSSAGRDLSALYTTFWTRLGDMKDLSHRTANHTKDLAPILREISKKRQQIHEQSEEIAQALHEMRSHVSSIDDFNQGALGPAMNGLLTAAHAAVEALREGQTLQVAPQPYPEPQQHATAPPDLVTWEQLRELGRQRREREASERARQVQAQPQQEPQQQEVQQQQPQQQQPSAQGGRRLHTPMDDVFASLREEMDKSSGEKPHD